MNTAVALIYTGAVLGSIFAISAVGLSLIYGTLRFLNLAHGSFLVVGGYAAWLAVDALGAPLWLALAIAMLVGGLLGIATYWVLLWPLRKVGSPRWDIATLMASVGLAIMIEAIILLAFGPRLKILPPAVPGQVVLGTTVIRWNALAIGAAAVAILFAINRFLTRSRYGIALRAVADDRTAADLMGIPSGRVYAATVAIGTSLAAAGGVLLSSFFLLRPGAGLDPMMTAIVVIVFGGLGSIRGTIVASYIIGFIQAAVGITIGVKWGLPVLFAVLIVVLVFRPYGLYGSPEETRA